MRTFFFPVLTRRQVSESGMRLRSSAGMTFSHTGFGTMPNMAPPSSLKNPSLTAWSSKSPSLCILVPGFFRAGPFHREGAAPPLRRGESASDDRRLTEREQHEAHGDAARESI